MAHKHSTAFVSALLVAVAARVVVPVLAQGPPGPTIGTDLSGEWAPLFHEDQPERIPGPDIGDYLGLPINEASRLHGDSWDASILTLPEHQCKPHPADYSPRGPANLRIWREFDGPSQQLVAAARADDLDGWPSASARVRRAHVAGVLDRHVGRRHADGDDHASEDGVDSPQRHPAQRHGRPHRALRAPRQLPDADLGDQRSGVSDRAVRAHDELGARSAPA